MQRSSKNGMVLEKLWAVSPIVLIAFVFACERFFKGHLYFRKVSAVPALCMMLIFFIWVLTDALWRHQRTIFGVIVQASFYIYIFFVLYLTGFFALAGHLSIANWWQNLLQRVDTLYGINLHVFGFLNQRIWWANYDVVGNALMLFPLGFYLPLLYKRPVNLFVVTLVAMVISCSIEVMQLIGGFRISDVNDVILNTAGAAIGYLIYLLLAFLFETYIKRKAWLLKT